MTVDTTLVSLLIAVVLLVGVSLGVQVWLVWEFLRFRRKLAKFELDIVDIKLQVHTRQSQASMQTGATTREQTLSRSGKQAAVKRVVVGGEDEAPQKQSLRATTQEQNDA